MVNAFKHIRLSGYNLIPQNVNGGTRLTLNSSGVAYYSELTGVSGYLQGLITTANADVSSINGLQNAVTVTGRDGIQIFVEGQNIVVSGNDAAVQSLITDLTTDLALTGSNLNTKINNLSGYSTDTFATITNLGLTGSNLNSRINTLSGNLFSTGQNLQGQINSFSGAFTTFTGNLSATFATDAELSAASGVLASSIASTGSNLQSSINSLSGYSNSTFATITGLAATGSALNTRINSLSGTLTENYYLKSNPSGFITSANVLFTSGDQTISGSKTFAASRYVFSGANVIFTSNTGIVSGQWQFSNLPTVNGTGVLLSGDIDLTPYATITNLGLTGSNLQGQINSLSGAFTTFTGNLASDFATDAELLAASGALSSRLNATGSALNISVNNLSGSLNATGSALNIRINNLSGSLNATGSALNTSVSNLSGSLNATGSALNTKINNLSGTLTSDYVKKATQQQFIVDLPTNIESTGITFPVVFASTPNSVQVTFEPSTDVTYMVAVKNRTTAGFTAEFSDVIFEAGNKLNVFASI